MSKLLHWRSPLNIFQNICGLGQNVWAFECKMTDSPFNIRCQWANRSMSVQKKWISGYQFTTGKHKDADSLHVPGMIGKKVVGLKSSNTICCFHSIDFQLNAYFSSNYFIVSKKLKPSSHDANNLFSSLTKYLCTFYW